MRRTGLAVVVIGLGGIAIFTNMAEGARPYRGLHGACTDPIPDARQAQLLERFGDEGIDANSDGLLTCEEVKAFFAEHRPMGPCPGGCHQACTDPIPAARQTMLLERFGEQGIDANSDGLLTCEEVKAFFEQHRPMGPCPGGCHQECTDPIPAARQTMLLERFGDQGIDANSDGLLTCEEVKAFFATHGAGHHGRGFHGDKDRMKGGCGARCSGDAGARADGR